jgi:hypothetical protein
MVPAFLGRLFVVLAVLHPSSGTPELIVPEVNPAPLVCPQRQLVGLSFVFFADERVRFTAEVPNDRLDRGATLCLPENWSLVDKDGIRYSIASVGAKRTESARPESIGEAAKISVVLDLGILPTGEYRLIFQKGGPSETSADFSVRTGAETVEVRKLHLRYAAEAALGNAERRGSAGRLSTVAFRQFKRYLSELAAIEPTNAWIYERVAEVSIDVVPPAETSELFATALKRHRELLVERFGSLEKLPTADRQHWQQTARRLTAFDRLMARNRIEGTSYTLLPLTVGTEKRYAVLDRHTRKVLGFAD